MKKIMIMALAATLSASAFAQNPDALKQIKKAKTTAEAAALVKSNETSMSASENAQAYNKLVDLVMVGVDKANQAIQTNMAMEQMGQAPKEAVDKKQFGKDLIEAFNYALKCDSYDVQPNEKGKVAPKFRAGNSNRLSNLRIQLIIVGQDYQADDAPFAADCFGAYAESGAAPLFAEAIQKAGGDENLSEVARVAALSAFQNKDMAKALKYADVMMAGDQESKNTGLVLKMYFLEQSAVTAEDSLKCMTELENLYKQYPENNDVFANLAQWYSNLGKKEQQMAVVTDRLQKDPNNYTAWAMKGQNEMIANDYDTAIASFKKAAENAADDKQKGQMLTFVGLCHTSKAAAASDAGEKYEKQIELIKEAIPYLEQAKQLDPQREVANWAYALYQCYYNVYGENDEKTKAIEAIMNGGY